MKKENKRKDQYQSDRERNDRLNQSDRLENKNHLPGIYPPQEDIMYRRDIERVGQKGEEFSRRVRYDRSDGINGRLGRDASETDDEFTTGEVNDLEEPREQEMEYPVPQNIDIDDDEDLDGPRTTEWDVTPEDLQALGPKDISLNMAEDEGFLKNRIWPVDMAAKDLDLPTDDSEDDKIGESIGPRDEENDFYSLGGDRHEDDMEGK